MRANIPKEPRPPVVELEGIYLQAMKEASVRLMEILPAGNDLWEMLGQIEAMLLEAQFREMPLTELFGEGGVAALCQSIIDEYKADGKVELPAAADRTVEYEKRIFGPSGGINYRRHRVTSVIIATVLILAFALLALWYTGILRYWSAGDSYYLEELHNFQSTVTDTVSPPVSVSLPLKPASGLGQILYTDAEGYTIKLMSLETSQHVGSYLNPHTGKAEYRKMTAWVLAMSYTVKSDFKQITYVEPPAGGVVTVTLSDGSVHEGKIVWMESGSAGEGLEFARISVIELPSDTPIEGATLNVVLDPPKRVEWNRISTGYR
jgi:DNA-binding ferritin-like protein (Dps family)